MSVTVKTFKVKSLSKYGFFADGVEKGVYFSKKLLEADKTRIVPGVSFDGELFTSDSGGLYLNKVTAFHESKKVEKSAEKTVEKAVEKKSFKAKDDTSMSTSRTARATASDGWSPSRRKAETSGAGSPAR